MKAATEKKVVSENRRARYDYLIESDLEVGIMLHGSEVKSLRRGGSNIADSYATIENGEIWLVNGYIAPLEGAAQFNHEPRRRRKLLASRREIARMWSALSRDGMTLVPLSLYANERGMMKLKLAIGKGKNKSDKRQASAKQDWNRQKARILSHGQRE